MARAETTFAIEVETQFSAAHAILIAGQRETLHGHDWRVVVSVAGDALDGEELLCDFHAVERMLAESVAPFVNRNLNDTTPFDRINPTAEALARHLFDTLAARVDAPQDPSSAPRGVRLEWVRVTEAPRCTAVVRRASQTPPTPSR